MRIDIDNDLDTDWKIDVKKSKASPPKQIRDFLGEFMATVEIQGKRFIFRIPKNPKIMRCQFGKKFLRIQKVITLSIGHTH